MARYIFDLEADGLLDTVTKVHSLVIKDVDTGLVRSCSSHGQGGQSIEVGLHVLSNADELIGHNIIKYDIAVLSKLYGFSPKGKMTDTLVASRLIFSDIGDKDDEQIRKGKFTTKFRGSHSLKAWGFRLGKLKGEFGSDDENAWAAWTPEMQAYCEQDVEVTEALYRLIIGKNYSPQAMELEHRFADIIAKMERNGFGFDTAKARELYVSLVGKRLEIAKELKVAFPPWWVAKGIAVPKRSMRFKDPTRPDVEEGAAFTRAELTEFNPSSRAHIADRLKKMFGWVPTETTETGQAKVDETVLSKLPYPEAKLLAKHFLVEKRIGQLAEGKQAWLLAETNGRIHGSVNTNGAVTGRCTHSRPNVAQVPSVKKDKQGNILMGEEGVWGYECRELFGPTRKGWVQVGADASGLELRCLAHFMARYDGGAYGKVLLEGDIHAANQEAAGLPTRATAKTFIYAFLYGAGDEKIGSIIGKGAEVGAKLKKAFLKKTPALKMLIEDVIATVRGVYSREGKLLRKGILKGLDGRLLHVRSQHAALNTLLQSAGALLVKQATVFLYDELSTRGYEFGRDWALLAHVHDEMQIECKKELANEIGQAAVEAIRRAGEHFKFLCPLDGEFKVGGNWAETH